MKPKRSLCCVETVSNWKTMLNWLEDPGTWQERFYCQQPADLWSEHLYLQLKIETGQRREERLKMMSRNTTKWQRESLLFWASGQLFCPVCNLVNTRQCSLSAGNITVLSGLVSRPSRPPSNVSISLWALPAGIAVFLPHTIAVQDKIVDF